MNFASYAEDASICAAEHKPWEGCHARPLDELEGAWVNVDCPFEQYMVEGQRVTRTDLRGTHHFTLHWDYERERWQWGTHGRLSLEWTADDTISWVPDVHAQHSKVWHWRRSGPPPPRRRGVGLPPVLTMSNYGAIRHPRTSQGQHHWAQPYSTPWLTTSSVVPPRAQLPGGSGVSSQWLDRTQRGWDCIDDSQGYHRYHDLRYEREFQHRDHGYYNWRLRGGGYYDFGVGNNASISLPCGLTTGEVSDLLSREITPEDYDLLLRLDKAVPKPTASAESIEGLPVVHEKEFMGGECTVCLCMFEAGDGVLALPCQHHFHRSCITKWLSECRRMCPLCGVEIPQAPTCST